MFESLNMFPITGSTVGELLANLFRPDQIWVLKDIETLTDVKTAIVLGDLWRTTRNMPVSLTTQERCDALNLASQIVSLDVQLQADPSVDLLIEDGYRVT